MQQMTFDGWLNSTAGINTENSVVRQARFQSTYSQNLDNLSGQYDESWLARRIVRADTEHALKRGFKSSGGIERFKQINSPDYLRDGVFQHAQHMANLHGVSAILLGAFSVGGSFESPVTPETVQVEWLDVLMRRHIKVVSVFSDANSANFGLPAVVEIVGDHRRAGLRLHTSRLIWLQGNGPRVSSQRFTGDDIYWGSSILIPVQEELARFGLSWAAVSHLINEASIAVWKMRGFREAASDRNSTEIEDRLTLISRSKSVARTIFLDADGGESFDRVAVSFADLPEILDRIFQVVASAANRPVSVLFGRQAAGLSNSGQIDLDIFYDHLETYQEYLGRKLETLLHFTEGGSRPTVTFPPLPRLSAKEQAEVRKITFEGDAVLESMGGIEGPALVRARKADDTLGVDVPAAPDFDEDEPNIVPDFEGTNPEQAEE